MGGQGAHRAALSPPAAASARQGARVWEPGWHERSWGRQALASGKGRTQEAGSGRLWWSILAGSSGSLCPPSPPNRLVPTARHSWETEPGEGEGLPTRPRRPAPGRRKGGGPSATDRPGKQGGPATPVDCRAHTEDCARPPQGGVLLPSPAAGVGHAGRRAWPSAPSCEGRAQADGKALPTGDIHTCACSHPFLKGAAKAPGRSRARPTPALTRRELPGPRSNKLQTG